MFSRAAFERVGGSCLTRAARLLRAGRASARALLRTLGRPLLRDERGSALIEFALIAPPFFLLLIGTLEVSMMFFASAVLEGATKEAARQIRTRSEEHTSELQSLMRISYAVFCLKKKNTQHHILMTINNTQLNKNNTNT